MKGNYKDFDMTNLNLTIVRDYSLYMALKSAGQGIGEKVRIHAFGFPLSKIFTVGHWWNGEIHASSCSLLVRYYNLYIALNLVNHGVG